jgi:translation initiation factor IF-3
MLRAEVSGLFHLARFTNDRQNRVPQNQQPINEGINAKSVRLIGADGEAVGIVSIEEALRMASDASLDLVLVSEDVTPPVCKILDYGKHRYEIQRKKVEARKKQKSVEFKEVQVRPLIGENDLLVKCRAIKKFVEAGNKVKVVLRFRGREIHHQDIGYEVLNKILDFCKDFAKEESKPKLEGSVVITVLSKR